MAPLHRGDGKAFPDLDAHTVFPVVYYDAMAAVLQALEQVHGDLSGGERQFQTALAKVRLESPIGPIHLDQDRQAVAPIYLRQYQRNAIGGVSSARSGSCRTSIRASAATSTPTVRCRAGRTRRAGVAIHRLGLVQGERGSATR